METNYEKRVYLLDDFRLFHLKDKNGTNIDYHYHEFCKLLLLRSGYGGYTVDGQRYDLKTGDAVLIGSQCVHRPEFEPGVLYEHCTEFIFTENMRERKHLLESRSDATIVVPGGIGTYEEFFEILTLKSLGRIDRPIVLYNINGYYDSMRALLEYTAGEKFMARDVVDMCRFMKDPEEILDYIENYRNYGGKL